MLSSRIPLLRLTGVMAILLTLSKDQLTYYRDILAKEAALAEESRLILQIIETHRTLVSTAVVKVLNTIADEFTKRIADE